MPVPQGLWRCAMLHIQVGDSSAQSLRASRVPGEVTVWADLLHEGPTPAGLSAHAWREVRAQYLASLAGQTGVDAIRQWLERQDTALAQAAAHEEVVIWVDACLYDQLILCYLLTGLATGAWSAPRVSLIAVGAFPGKERFLGLGELSPEELSSLFPDRQPVTAQQVALADRSWTAICAPDPTAILTVQRGDTAVLPYLGDALLRHLEQFPDVDGGLSRLQREILEAVDAGATDAPALFCAVSAKESRPFFGDTTLWQEVESLAQAPVPLLERQGPGPLPHFDEPSPADMAAWHFRLTPSGTEVLAGRQDAIELRGIDRWLGGVHLRGQGPGWRWAPRECRVVWK